jgi:hypothetical protein
MRSSLRFIGITYANFKKNKEGTFNKKEKKKKNSVASISKIPYGNLESEELSDDDPLRSALNFYKCQTILLCAH